jgi:hypothetical protein
LRGVFVVGNSWITDRAKQNRVETPSQHFESAFGQRNAFAQVFVGPPVEFDKLQLLAEHFVDALQDFH